jgi:hypothetical protein
MGGRERATTRAMSRVSDLKRCWIVVDEYNYDVAERS